LAITLTRIVLYSEESGTLQAYFAYIMRRITDQPSNPLVCHGPNLNSTPVVLLWNPHMHLRQDFQYFVGKGLEAMEAWEAA